MDTPRPLEIFEQPYRTDARTFELSTTNGTLRAAYWPEIARYHVCRIDSYQPRQGIGKFLIRASIEHARTLQAEHMTACVISRECLDDMMTVFGAEYVTVSRRGKYADKVRSEVDTSSAQLYYPLSDTPG